MFQIDIFWPNLTPIDIKAICWLWLCFCLCLSLHQSSCGERGTKEKEKGFHIAAAQYMRILERTCSQTGFCKLVSLDFPISSASLLSRRPPPTLQVATQAVPANATLSMILTGSRLSQLIRHHLGYVLSYKGSHLPPWTIIVSMLGIEPVKKSKYFSTFS